MLLGQSGTWLQCSCTAPSPTRSAVPYFRDGSRDAEKLEAELNECGDNNEATINIQTKEHKYFYELYILILMSVSYEIVESGVTLRRTTVCGVHYGGMNE